MRPLLLKFSERTMQGPHFQLATVAWGRNSLPGYHTHDYSEVFWLTDGECDHHLNGRTTVLPAGVLVLMRAADAHELRNRRGRSGFRFTNLSISPASYARLQKIYPRETALLYPKGGPPTSLVLTAAEVEVLNGEIRQLAAAPHTQFHLERAVINIWSRFLRGGKAGAMGGEGPDWLREALLRLEEQEFFARGVAGLVAAAGRCHEHVSRECRRHLGKTPTQIVNEARLRHAAHALRMTRRSVMEVAMDCGFENPAQFHRLFRAEYRTTPGRYRRG